MANNKQMTVKASKELYDRIQDIRKKTKLGTDAEALRFCVTYTITSLEILDSEHITSALGIAIAESLFNTDEPEK